MTRASFGITTHMTYQKPFWIWIRICVNFFVLSNFVNSEHRDTYDTSEKSCRKGLYFFFLRLRSLSTLWGRYDPKLKKADVFACSCVISSHRIKCNTSIESFYEGLHFFFLHWWAMNNIWGHYDFKTWKFDDLTVLGAVWFTLSVLWDLYLKPWADQHLLTFKVNVKVKLESFNCCLQQ